MNIYISPFSLICQNAGRAIIAIQIKGLKQLIIALLFEIVFIYVIILNSSLTPGFGQKGMVVCYNKFCDFCVFVYKLE